MYVFIGKKATIFNANLEKDDDDDKDDFIHE